MSLEPTRIKKIYRMPVVPGTLTILSLTYIKLQIEQVICREIIM